MSVRKRVHVIIAERSGMLSVIVTGSINSIPKGARSVYRIELTTVKGVPYMLITEGALRNYSGAEIDNHGIHCLPRGELENIKTTLLRICHGIHIEGSPPLIVEELQKPMVEIVEKNGNITPL